LRISTFGAFLKGIWQLTLEAGKDFQTHSAGVNKNAFLAQNEVQLTRYRNYRAAIMWSFFVYREAHKVIGLGANKKTFLIIAEIF
jgi:hypothetical protein